MSINVKERYQNPTPNDTVRLRLMAFNSNNFANVESIENVLIYNIDNCEIKCPTNGRLVATIPGSEVVLESTGKYYVDVVTSSPNWIIGSYSDVWNLNLPGGQKGQTSKLFKLYSELWYFGTLPPVYTFDFRFQPNRFRQGSKKYIVIQIIPNVPRASDLEEFYTALAITGNIRITIEKACGPCPPPVEQDLRIIVDKELVELREKVFGYYFFDTTELDCGLFNIWFDLEVADIHEVSQKYQIQIF